METKLLLKLYREACVLLSRGNKTDPSVRRFCKAFIEQHKEKVIKLT